jgi:hypothetical protein
MNSPNQSPESRTPPPLAELMSRYLGRQVSAQASGLAIGEQGGEVVPHDAVPVQPVEPRVAWDEAVSVLRWFRADKGSASWSPPADWPALVANLEPASALAYCVGNYPQMVRNLLPLMRATDLTTLQPACSRPVPVAKIVGWSEELDRSQTFPQALLTLGVLRLSRHFEVAQELIQQLNDHVSAPWVDAWANEKAALAWHRGEAREAEALWQQQASSVPVLFNRGMAALFLGKSTKARPLLSAAVAQLPEDDAWHHLGCLYLALAEMRSQVT